jgi:hypothetical protein
MRELKTSLEPGEIIVEQGRANAQRGAESVGGWLYLTDRRLIFESHSLNVQTGETIIPRDQIASVTKEWTRFLNRIPLAPNSIEVHLRGEESYRFVVNGRKSWIAAIETEGVQGPPQSAQT